MNDHIGLLTARTNLGLFGESDLSVVEDMTLLGGLELLLKVAQRKRFLRVVRRLGEERKAAVNLRFAAVEAIGNNSDDDSDGLSTAGIDLLRLHAHGMVNVDAAWVLLSESCNTLGDDSTSLLGLLEELGVLEGEDLLGLESEHLHSLGEYLKPICRSHFKFYMSQPMMIVGLADTLGSSEPTHLDSRSSFIDDEGGVLSLDTAYTAWREFLTQPNKVRFADRLNELLECLGVESADDLTALGPAHLMDLAEILKLAPKNQFIQQFIPADFVAGKGISFPMRVQIRDEEEEVAGNGSVKDSIAGRFLRTNVGASLPFVPHRTVVWSYLREGAQAAHTVADSTGLSAALHAAGLGPPSDESELSALEDLTLLSNMQIYFKKAQKAKFVHAVQQLGLELQQYHGSCAEALRSALGEAGNAEALFLCSAADYSAAFTLLQAPDACAGETTTAPVADLLSEMGIYQAEDLVSLPGADLHVLASVLKPVAKSLFKVCTGLPLLVDGMDPQQATLLDPSPTGYPLAAPDKDIQVSESVSILKPCDDFTF